METAWLPFMDDSQTNETRRHGWIHLAWDDDNLYVGAAIQDDHLDRRSRLSERDEDDYFHGPDREAVMDRYAAFAGEVGHGQPIDWSKANNVYRRDPRQALAWTGDAFQFDIDIDRPEDRYKATHDLTYSETLPDRYAGMPDTDFEFSLYLTLDGDSELWQSGDRHTPRIHLFPRQPLGHNRPHAVDDAKHRIENVDGTTVHHLALPWPRLGLNGPPAVTSRSV